MKLSVIILNYNVTQLLRKCLQSIRLYADVPCEVIVIDNASPDDTWRGLMAEFPEVTFIAEAENRGFAVANNKAAAAAKGEFIYILNPDTELEGYYLKEIIGFAERQADFGCLGIRMHNAAGDFLPESKRSVPNLINSFEKLFVGFRKKNSKSYYRDDIGEFDVAEVEVITGANMLIRRDLFLEAGGFDERYFMYGEDIDLCYTILQKGYRNWYYGKASLLHHKGESTEKNEKYLADFYGAMQIFLDKYYAGKSVQHKILSAGLRVRYFLSKQNLR